MGTLLQDLKYGLRIHAKALGLTTIAVLTLALGIGACTAVFGVVDAILLRPLPYSESEKIVIPWRLARNGAGLGFDKIPWGVNQFQLFVQDSKTLQDIGAFQSQSFLLTGVDEPKLLDGMRASAGFFSVLGVSPVIGRTFTPEEEWPGREHEVILSYALWQEHFGGSAHLIGLSLDLNGKAYTVIGVMPPGFSFPRANEMPSSFEFPPETQLWIPLVLPARTMGPAELTVIGRLKPGVSLEKAQSEWDVFSRRLDAENPQSTGWFNSRVTLLNVQVVGDTRLPLLLMLAAVGAVLLIACSNVASYCSRGPWCAGGNLPCGRRSAQDTTAWSARCSQKVFCWPSPPLFWVSCWERPAYILLKFLVPRIFRGCRKPASIRKCWPSP
jgi:putative ABC transport system permease protein